MAAEVENIGMVRSSIELNEGNRDMTKGIVSKARQPPLIFSFSSPMRYISGKEEREPELPQQWSRPVVFC